jgi:putative transposase
MRELYQLTGTSKQNFHQRVIQNNFKQGELAQLEMLMYKIRDDHPGLGGKKMYHMLQPHFIGRDQFLEFYSSLGFCVKSPKNYRRTTNSSAVIRFPNMVENDQPSLGE